MNRQNQRGGTSRPLFDLGQIVATPGALELLRETNTNPTTLILRHVCGDWGCVPPEDKMANERSLIDGSRILSSYVVNGEKVWIITEAKGDDGQRFSTCILLASEY